MSIEAFAKAVEIINAHDAKRFAATYAADAVVHDPLYPQPLKGRDAVEQDMVELLRAFPDHHAYTAADMAELAGEADRVARGGGMAVCTLKDAVKLSPRWPSGEPALSFLSQQVIVEAGRTTLDDLLDSVIHARKPTADAAG